MAPELTVVVASRDRPLRLRWLLNALAEQTLARGRWEVVVCHDSIAPETDELLAGHELAGAGVLRAVRAPRSSAGAKRNVGVTMARGTTIVFTDDDCRPPAQWLERVQEAAREHPGSIIQGPIEGDPDEDAMRRAPYPRTQSFSDVPTPWAECCNIAYPGELIGRAGGFDEQIASGEDTDLRLRVQALGASYLGEPRMRTYHAIEDRGVIDWVRSSFRWDDVPWLYRRYPELRTELFLRVFWKPKHFWLLIGLLALPGVARRPWRVLALLPWAAGRGAHGTSLRGQARDLAELPGWALVDLAEIYALARGSLRHRTIVL